MRAKRQVMADEQCELFAGASGLINRVTFPGLRISG